MSVESVKIQPCIWYGFFKFHFSRDLFLLDFLQKNWFGLDWKIKKQSCTAESLQSPVLEVPTHHKYTNINGLRSTWNLVLNRGRAQPAGDTAQAPGNTTFVCPRHKEQQCLNVTKVSGLCLCQHWRQTLLQNKRKV